MGVNRTINWYPNDLNRVQTNTKVTDHKLNSALVRGNSIDFGKIYEDATKPSELNFSKHATQRLSERSIELSTQDLTKLQNALQSASEKGINDSLVIMNKVAFIMNVPSGTVVTVVPGDELGDSRVFSNIDGAVII